MITAVDTNVLIDVLTHDPIFGEPSASVLRNCLGEGSLVACEVVWAELRPVFRSDDELGAVLATAQISFSALSQPAAMAAGAAWKEYRLRGGNRQRLLGDFLVFGHAQHQADRLLTRDHGFARTYFPGLTVIDPSTR